MEKIYDDDLREAAKCWRLIEAIDIVEFLGVVFNFIPVNYIIKNITVHCS